MKQVPAATTEVLLGTGLSIMVQAEGFKEGNWSKNMQL
jgi:hypothetical protein